MSTSRKLQAHQEGPLDNILLWGVACITPLLHYTGHTPNLITTYSLGLGLLSSALLGQGRFGEYCAASAASYFFDCTDGYFARTYGQTSVLGDLYDHFTDVSTTAALVWVSYCRYYELLTVSTLMGVVLPLWLLPLWLMLRYLGCQQALLRSNTHESLDVLKPLSAHPELEIVWLRYFSCASFRLFTFATLGILEALRCNHVLC